jgi:hypothetical protein
MSHGSLVLHTITCIFTIASTMQLIQRLQAMCMNPSGVQHLPQVLRAQTVLSVQQQGSPPVRNAAMAAAKLGKHRDSTASMGALQSMSSMDADNQYDLQYDTDTPAPLPLPQPTVHDVSGLLQNRSCMSLRKHAAV